MHWTLAIVSAFVVWAMSAYWRPGSIALGLSWMLAQFYWLATGEQTPIALYAVIDLTVIAVLIAYRSSALDWAILGIFPLQWQAYLWSDPVQQWWFLWGAVVLQLILAGPWKVARKFHNSDTEVRRQYVEAQ